MLKKNEVIALEITGMTSEGNGVGRHEGIAVFVPLTAVGDKITCKIVKTEKSYCYGIIEEIKEAAPCRTPADCEVYRQCGGCCFRHFGYEEELRIKDNIVRDAFRRIGGIDTEFEEILGCESRDGYRNKAQYPVADKDGQAVCGFFAKRSHRIIPYTDCRLQPPIFREITDFIISYINENKIPAYNEQTGKGSVRHIYLRRGYHSGEIMVCIVSAKNISGEIKPLCNLLTEKFPDIKSIVVNLNPAKTNVILGERIINLYGDGYIRDIMCKNKIRLSPLSFYQVNTPQAERLYAIAKEYANLDGGERIMDLYCGTGTIGLSMADKAGSLIGVEIIPEAVRDARFNAAENGISNAEFICDSAGKAARKLSERGELPDVITVDPPRKGCDEETVAALLKMAPKRIVMISCNPATCARDVKLLCESGIYRTVKARAVDMFPGTGHVETAVLLSKLN